MLYTGNQLWTANTTYAENQWNEKSQSYETIDVKYKLIDVNKYKIEELLKEKTMLSNAMILEKCKNNEEVIQNLREIIKNIDNKTEFLDLKRIVIYLYSKVEKSKIQNILKLLEERECEDTMSTIAERLKEEYINAEKKGINDTIKRMIKMNLENDFIKKATGVEEKEIEKIREQIKKDEI